MNIAVPEYIRSIDPYVPGKPIEAVQREYGIADSIKLASNENPLGPSPMALKAIAAAAAGLHRYPDGAGHGLVDKLAARLGVKPRSIVLGNGSDEIIGLLARTLLRAGDEVILPQPSFLMYAIMARSVGAVPAYVPLKALAIDLDAMAARVTDATRMIFLCNPNNPSGTIIAGTDLARFLGELPPEVAVVLDEAYIEFVRDPDCARGLEHLGSNRAIAVLRTFSKAYGLAGLRIGYGVMPEEVSALVHRIRPPFNTSLLAQAAATAALDDEDFLQRTRTLVHAGLAFLQGELRRLGVAYFATEANFFLIDVKRNADEVFEALLRRGVIVRSMASYGFPQYIRINVGLEDENRRFIAALEAVLGGGNAGNPET